MGQSMSAIVDPVTSAQRSVRYMELLRYIPLQQRLERLLETEQLLSQTCKMRRLQWPMWKHPQRGLDLEMVNLIEPALQKQCYNCAMAVAVALPCLHRMEVIVKRLPAQEQAFWDYWMPHLVNCGDFDAILMIVSKFPKRRYSNCLHLFIDCSEHVQYTKEELVKKDAAARAILHHSSNRDTPKLVNLFKDVVSMCNNPMLELLLYCDNAHVQLAVESVFMSFLRFELIELLEQDSNTRTDDSFLSVACKAGLPTILCRQLSSIDFYTLATEAVINNQLAYVRILYTVGLLTNRGLFDLSKIQSITVKEEEERIKELKDSLAIRYRVEKLDGAREIAAFLSSKASEPRSLESLCFLEISRHLGWGLARARNVDNLPSPLTTVMKQKLKNGCVE